MKSYEEHPFVFYYVAKNHHTAHSLISSMNTDMQEAIREEATFSPRGQNTRHVKVHEKWMDDANLDNHFKSTMMSFEAYKNQFSSPCDGCVMNVVDLC